MLLPKKKLIIEIFSISAGLSSRAGLGRHTKTLSGRENVFALWVYENGFKYPAH
jgi:hypothetical protein